MVNSGFRYRCAKVAILATALLVFWIYLGSLINFHQHHIFGRTLIPNGILCKREEMTEISPDLPSLDFFQAPAISVEECRNLLNPEFSEILHSGLYSSTISYLGIPANHGLRAPPAIS